MSDAVAKTKQALKSVEKKLETAKRKFEKLFDSQPGEPAYDKIVGKGGVDGEAAKQLKLEEYDARIEKMSHRQSKLMDKLEGMGQDVMTSFRAAMVAEVKRCAADPFEQFVRKMGDEENNKKRPIKNIDVCDRVLAAYTATCTASRHARSEPAKVTVLSASELMENDVDAYETTYSCEHAGDKLDKTRSVRSGVLLKTSASVTTFCLNPILAGLLKPYQIECVNFLLDRLTSDAPNGGRGALVSHAMGLGKTLSTLAALDLLSTMYGRLHIVVVCPVSVVANWAAEVFKWRAANAIKELHAYPITSLSDEAGMLSLWKQQGGLLIMSPNRLVRSFSVNSHSCMVEAVEEVKDSTILVIDEAHRAKNEEAQLYQTVLANFPKRRILLSGTPIQNNLKELFSLVNLVEEGLLGDSAAQFEKSYITHIEQLVHSSSTTESEMKDLRIAEQCLALLTKSVVHHASLDQIAHLLPSKYEFRLQHECETDDTCMQRPFRPLVARSKQLNASREDKMKLAGALINEIHSEAPDDQIVVFSESLETLKGMAKAYPGDVFDGETSSREREQYLENFRAGIGTILYVSVKAGGEGINLTCANRVILMDVHWNPTVDAQAVARCHRMGQKKTVFVYRLVGDEPVESAMYTLCLSKAGLSLRVMDEKELNNILTYDNVWDSYHSAAKDGADAALMSAELTMMDPCLANLCKTRTTAGLSIYSHDKWLSGAKIPVCETHKAAALNINSLSKWKCLTACYDSEHKLVTPMVPIFFQVNGDTYMPCVEFTVASSYVRLSPKTPKGLLHRIYARVPGGGEDRAYEQVCEIDMITSSIDIDADVTFEFDPTPTLKYGTYEFASRLFCPETQEQSELSEFSAPIVFASDER